VGGWGEGWERGRGRAGGRSKRSSVRGVKGSPREGERGESAYLCPVQRGRVSLGEGRSRSGRDSRTREVGSIILRRVQVEMLRAQVKELKGAPADQVVRVSSFPTRDSFWQSLISVQVDEKRRRADDAA